MRVKGKGEIDYTDLTNSDYTDTDCGICVITFVNL